MDENDKKIQELIDSSFISSYLEDEDITDIRYNGTDLRLKHKIRGPIKPEKQPTLEEVQTLIRRMADFQGKGFTDTEAILDTQFGILRVNAVHTAGSPFGTTMALRVSRARKAMNDLSDVSTKDVGLLLEVFIKAGISIVLSGMTGSGKTEVQKMLVGFIDDDTTISLIEDTMDSHIKELYPLKDINSWRILDGDDRTKKFTGSDFIKAGLRNDSDWILISEIRDPEESYEMVQSALTGHSMLTTLHASKAGDIPSRLLNMIGQKYSINELLFGKDIVSTIPIGIHMEQDINENGEIIRYIREIVEFTDFNEQGAISQPIYQVKNVYVSGDEYNTVRETYPISERMTKLLQDKKMFHLLPDAFRLKKG